MSSFEAALSRYGFLCTHIAKLECKLEHAVELDKGAMMEQLNVFQTERTQLFERLRQRHKAQAKDEYMEFWR